ncbi:hypothetical protein DIU38_008135 [Mucilaginibacter sp. P4]|nr:hypothetical protein DIU38_008135 [Mucilaginibacter gossypii]
MPLAGQSQRKGSYQPGRFPSWRYLSAGFPPFRKKVVKQTSPTVIQHNQEEINLQVPEVQSWDEFHPRLYSLRTEVIDSKGQVLDARTQSFGFRDINATGNELRINGRPLFLRGTLECNIFPLEGHPPMNTAGWLKVFKTAKAYGLNHLRFHSWCPPEAAFQVADSLGFYLHVELPLWALTVGKDPKTLTYLEQEAENIIRNYGNHPSFCFWSMGNELEGDFGWLEKLVRKLKQEDNRHLYTTTTFSFQKGHGKNPDPADDYFITQYTEKGWVRDRVFSTLIRPILRQITVKRWKGQQFLLLFTKWASILFIRILKK